MKTTAVLTMVFNEPEYIPLWLKYYGGLFGEDNLYIIDHGSDDGSVENVGRANVIKLPRSPKNNPQRSRGVSHQTAMLLQFYDRVIHVDVDEFLIADPRNFSDLRDFCSRPLPSKVVTSIGLNVYHLTQSEPDLNLKEPVMAQRRWAQFVSPMCKPSIVASPVTFGDGFHGSNEPPVFSDIYLLHLRYFDKQNGLLRLARTRSMDWANPNAGAHQRVEDDKWVTMIEQFNKIPKGPELFTDEADAELSKLKEEFLSTVQTTSKGIFTPSIRDQIRSQKVFSVPEKCRSLF